MFRSTFEAIQKQIFERRGCTSTICHGGPPFQGGLDLRPDVAYESIVREAVDRGEHEPHHPGARDRSYLYMKLAAATDPSQLNGFQIVNAPMPNGLEPLTTDELEAVRLWIYNGAPKTGIDFGNRCAARRLPAASRADLHRTAASSRRR